MDKEISEAMSFILSLHHVNRCEFLNSAGKSSAIFVAFIDCCVKLEVTINFNAMLSVLIVLHIFIDGFDEKHQRNCNQTYDKENLHDLCLIAE
jgi:hypothetical protein